MFGYSGTLKERSMRLPRLWMTVSVSLSLAGCTLISMDSLRSGDDGAGGTGSSNASGSAAQKASASVGTQTGAQASTQTSSAAVGVASASSSGSTGGAMPCDAACNGCCSMGTTCAPFSNTQPLCGAKGQPCTIVCDPGYHCESDAACH